MTTTRKIFLDLDGVMADFEGHYLTKFGHAHDSVNDPQMWRNINSCDDWWTTMVKMHTHDELWEAIKEYNPTVLTGCPISKYEHAAEGKKIWCENIFGSDVPVITCLSKNKQNHMINKGDILIDDMEKNCNNWTEAGGHAILFDPRNIKEVINEIRALMDNKE